MSNVTVWYDGACPLCRREIALLQRLDRRRRIRFVDVSPPDAAAACPVERTDLLARFHARERGRPVVSGAAAFAVVYRQIPWLAPLGQLLRVPPLLWLAERAYRGFLHLRPQLQRLAGAERRS